jgi:DNA-binding LytR/AlgR family response regulator
MSVAPALPDSFFVKADYQMVRVSVADIRYIEGLDDYIKIYTTAEKPLLTHTSLRAIGERLPASQFVRIHRSYIIALDRIESYTKKTISINGRELPIGESYAEALWERLR